MGEAIAARAAEEEGNAMKALENRTLDSKREMDIMAALDELQTLNKRQARVDTEAALAALHRSAAVSEDDQARPQLKPQPRHVQCTLNGHCYALDRHSCDFRGLNTGSGARAHGKQPCA